MAESTVLPSGDKNALSERQKEILVQVDTVANFFSRTSKVEKSKSKQTVTV